MLVNKYKFKTKPMEHQIVGLGGMMSQFENHSPEYALFMEMGCGKTKVLIDGVSILYDNGKIDQLLVICPNGIKYNWRDELEKHLADHIEYDVHVWEGAKTKKEQSIIREKLFPINSKLKILIMNVDSIITNHGTKVADKFTYSGKSLMCIDESTIIKNMTTKRTKRCIKIGQLARYRVILTGSPITKSPEDIYGQCAFLNEDLLGFSSIYSFRARYCDQVKLSFGGRSFNKVTGYKRLEELTEKLRKFSYRVTKDEALDLPDKIYMKRRVPMNEKQLKAYVMMKKLALVSLEEGELTTATLIAQLKRLHQIACGYMSTDEGDIIDFSENRIKELLDTVEEVGGKVIIWCSYRHNIHKVIEALTKKYGQDAAEGFYGETPSKERPKILKKFTDKDNPLRFLVGHPRTGGYGLTLTVARTMIFYSNDYDLEIREQAEARNHRIGTTNKVTYVDLVCEGTVDENILKSLRQKINIATQIMGEEFKEWLI
jgi:SNF2 family DNA or RNA helicase